MKKFLFAASLFAIFNVSCAEAEAEKSSVVERIIAFNAANNEFADAAEQEKFTQLLYEIQKRCHAAQPEKGPDREKCLRDLFHLAVQIVMAPRLFRMYDPSNPKAFVPPSHSRAFKQESNKHLQEFIKS